MAAAGPRHACPAFVGPLSVAGAGTTATSTGATTTRTDIITTSARAGAGTGGIVPGQLCSLGGELDVPFVVPLLQPEMPLPTGSTSSLPRVHDRRRQVHGQLHRRRL